MDDLMAMMGDVFDDDRLRMPYPERWVHMDKILPRDTLTYRLDLGSVMVFTEDQQQELADRCRVALNEVGRICKGEWLWNTHEDAVRAEVNKVGPGGRIISVMSGGPVDQRKFLYINFASRDDAMLVRMTIADLRSVKNADSGGMPQAS